MTETEGAELVRTSPWVPLTRRISRGMILIPKRPDAFGLLSRNLRHLRGNDLPSPIPFYENAQMAESSTSRIPLYARAALGYGYVSVDLNCDFMQFVQLSANPSRHSCGYYCSLFCT